MDKWKTMGKKKPVELMKVKKLNNNAKLPTRGTSGSAGLDLYSVEDVIIRPDDIIGIHTGIGMEIPTGCYGLLVTRSSIGKNGVRVAAGANIVDAEVM